MRRRRSAIVTRNLLAGAALGIAGTATAQQATPNFEGVWKIAAPTQTLQPVSGPVPFTAEGRKAYAANRSLRAAGKINAGSPASPVVAKCVVVTDIATKAYVNVMQATTSNQVANKS